jgi:hypothetical protein
VFQEYGVVVEHEIGSKHTMLKLFIGTHPLKIEGGNMHQLNTTSNTIKQGYRKRGKAKLP